VIILTESLFGAALAFVLILNNPGKNTNNKLKTESIKVAGKIILLNKSENLCTLYVPRDFVLLAFNVDGLKTVFCTFETSFGENLLFLDLMAIVLDNLIEGKTFRWFLSS
jgi:hypothetical protein